MGSLTLDFVQLVQAVPQTGRKRKMKGRDANPLLVDPGRCLLMIGGNLGLGYIEKVKLGNILCRK